MNFSVEEKADGYMRTWGHGALCGLAALTWMAGKAVMVLNATWLFLRSLLDYTGIYDQCYCKGEFSRNLRGNRGFQNGC